MEEKEKIVYCEYKEKCSLYKKKSILCVVKNIKMEVSELFEKPLKPECMLYEAKKYIDMKFKNINK
ncbi:hypothetical protein LCGC14_0546640 [marine sediment metagenome]|uniref:Uncharacterized protein n=1 Tax=marine sediment metagenome TaxID=412755 RepID=A0A0F9RVZ7_9ZZZZ